MSINFKRIKLALWEFWQLNYRLILTIPILFLAAFLLYYYMPGSFLNRLTFDKMDTSGIYAVENAILNERTTSKLSTLFLCPLLIIVITNRYLIQANRSVRATLLPIKTSEKIISLWLFSLGTLLICIASYMVIDLATTKLFSYFFRDRVVDYIFNTGEIYPLKPYVSLFETSPSGELFGTALLLMLLFPIYCFARLYLKRHSLAKVLGILITFTFAIIYVTRLWFKSVLPNTNEYVNNQGPALFVQLVIIALIYFLFTKAAYYCLKDKEV